MEELHCRSRPCGVTSSSRGLAVALGAVALWSKLCRPLLPLVLLSLPSPEPRRLGRCLDAPRPSRAIVPVRQHVITRVTTENELLESRGAWDRDTSSCSEVRTRFLGSETWTPRGNDLLRDGQGLSGCMWLYRGHMGGCGRQHLERAGMAKMPAFPEERGWAVVRHDWSTRLFIVGEVCPGTFSTGKMATSVPRKRPRSAGSQRTS